jgi:hypothetical protein
MKTLALGVLLFLAACASTTNERRDSVALVWTHPDDIQAACEELTRRKELYTVRGCSKWRDEGPARLCTIYAPRPRSDTDTQAFVTLGHELMHCFDGNWHDRWGRTAPLRPGASS